MAPVMSDAWRPEQPDTARLRHLTVHDFRNLADVAFDVPRQGLALVGDNGHGKTNVLEAVYYLHLFRSLRGARDIELVRFGRPTFHVAATAEGTRWSRIGAGFEREWVGAIGAAERAAVRQLGEQAERAWRALRRGVHFRFPSAACRRGPTASR